MKRWKENFRELLQSNTSKSLIKQNYNKKNMNLQIKKVESDMKNKQK